MQYTIDAFSKDSGRLQSKTETDNYEIVKIVKAIYEAEGWFVTVKVEA